MEDEYAIDLDGTLAHYDKYRGDHHIGEPVPSMIAFAKSLIAEGKRVVIFTARADNNNSIALVKEWCVNNGLGNLEVTNIKRKSFRMFYDDRAVAVRKNLGFVVTDQDAMDVQIDGSHYKKYSIQPIEFVHANKIPAIEASVIKYIVRHADKNGKSDLEKARHLIDILIKLEYDA